MSKRPSSSRTTTSIKRGIIIYTDQTPVGFGKAAKAGLQNQTRFNQLAWPKSKKSDYEYSAVSLKTVNMKHYNGIKGNPVMNS